jgi:hypothetical protein
MRARVLAVAAVLLLSGCASSRWEEARRTDTISGCEQFVREFPNTE